MTEEQREEVVKCSIDNKSEEDAYKDLSINLIHCAFDIIGIKNGYFRLIGAFEDHIQMCYWYFKIGNKLVSLYFEGCSPVCYIEQFDIYEYNGKYFKPIDWHLIIPEVFEDLFIDQKYDIEEMKQKDILATLLFDLPGSGRNIIAKWGNENAQETYKKYGFGDRMILICDDGKFKKGEIFWK